MQKMSSLNFRSKIYLKKLRPKMKLKKIKCFELKDEVLHYNGRVCIHKFGEYRLNIMNNLQYILIASHPGFQKTYKAIKRHCY